MKQCCRNCHFLMNTFRPPNGISYKTSWNKQQRETGKLQKCYSPSCWFGIWDVGIEPSLTGKLNEIIDENRKNACFFIETYPGMSFSAARIIQHRRDEYAQLRRSNRYTMTGLWIAAIALFVNTVVTLLK